MPHSDNSSSQAREAWDLIPWVANGSASPEERERVQAHVKSCQDCADELAFQRRLQRAMAREPEPVASPEPALQALLQRMDDEGPTQVRARRRSADRGLLRHRLLIPGLVGAVLMEACAIALLVVGLTWLQTPQMTPGRGFRTLTAEAPAPQPGTLRVVFAAGMQMDQIQRLLARLHLQIVAGPSPAGALTLASVGSSSADATAALAALRRDPGVRFAEPVGANAP